MKRNKTIHNEQYNSLIEQLRQERRFLALSQTELAHLLNMTQSDISKIETVERRIDILEFKSLLRAYRVNDNARLKRLVIEFLELE